MKFTVAAVGDLGLANQIDGLFPPKCDWVPEPVKPLPALAHADPRAYLFGDTLEILSQADIRLGNLETPLSNRGSPYCPKGWLFRTRPERIQEVTHLNMSCVGLANNHTLDFGPEAADDTIKALSSAGVACAGIGKDLASALAPATFLSGSGHRCVAWSLACTGYDGGADSCKAVPALWAAKEDRYGNAYADLEGYHRGAPHPVKAAIAAYMAAHRDAIDFAIVFTHWGRNYQWEPDAVLADFAHDLVDECGIDLVHGTSAHHVQAVELYHGSVVFYSCCGFVDDYLWNDTVYPFVDDLPGFRPDISFIGMATFTLAPSEAAAAGACAPARRKKWCARDVLLHPVRIKDLSVSRSAVTPEDLNFFGTKITQLCARFGMTVAANNDRTFLVKASPGGQGEGRIA